MPFNRYLIFDADGTLLMDVTNPPSDDPVLFCRNTFPSVLEADMTCMHLTTQRERRLRHFTIKLGLQSKLVGGEIKECSVAEWEDEWRTKYPERFTS